MRAQTGYSHPVSKKPSPARQALMWWFDAPVNAHVSANIAVDFTAARAYLTRLQADGAPVTVHHLVVAVIARVLREFPVANARIFAGRVVRKEEVGVVMPVNLIGHSDRSELSMSIIPRVDRMPLRELAARQRREVAEERSGTPRNPLFRALFRMTEVMPAAVVRRTLDVLDLAWRTPILSEAAWGIAPFTTAITNPGAAFGAAEGVWFRGAAVSLPQRLTHVGTLWGISGVQPEVVPVDGRPEVRPVLPVVLVFDHRLFDGVMAGRILMRFAEILMDPAAIFGELGTQSAAHTLPESA